MVEHAHASRIICQVFAYRHAYAPGKMLLRGSHGGSLVDLPSSVVLRGDWTRPRSLSGALCLLFLSLSLSPSSLVYSAPLLSPVFYLLYIYILWLSWCARPFSSFFFFLYFALRSSASALLSLLRFFRLQTTTFTSYVQRPAPRRRGTRLGCFSVFF